MATTVQDVRRATRSRGFLAAAVIVIAILVAQIVTTLSGVVLATRQFDEAALDTYSYVGDLTAERVARYANSARTVVEGTAFQLERDPQISQRELTDSAYLRLRREDTVRAVYAGWVDGSFMMMQRFPGGYEVLRRDVATEPQATHVVYDALYREVSSALVDTDFDPRERPWFIAGLGSTRTSWTEPYLQFSTTETLVSAARATRGPDGLVAVVGADLELSSLGQLLDDLPLGAGASAYVLSPDGAVIAAPSSQAGEVREQSAAQGRVPTAADFDIVLPPEPLVPGEDSFAFLGDQILLDRAFDYAESLDWVLHVSAQEAQLSRGLDRVSQTVYVVTALSFLAALAAVVLAIRVWRPLRTMRDRAATDQLTGLANRHEFIQRGTTLVSRATARGDTVLAVVLDLDNFKQLNDRYGHDAGDRALEAVAIALRENIRAGDIAARTGGDEFVIIQILGADDEPYDVVARTRDQIEHALHTRVLGGESVGVTAGFATAWRVDRLDGLVARADRALVEGKRTQKGRVYDGSSPRLSRSEA